MSDLLPLTKPTLLFDGQCAVCRRIALWVQRSAKNRGATDWQRPRRASISECKPEYMGCVCSDPPVDAGWVHETGRRSGRRSAEEPAQLPVVRLELPCGRVWPSTVSVASEWRVHNPLEITPTARMRKLRNPKPVDAAHSEVREMGSIAFCEAIGAGHKSAFHVSAKFKD